MKEMQDVLTRIIPHICVFARHSSCKADKFQKSEKPPRQDIEHFGAKTGRPRACTCGRYFMYGDTYRGKSAGEESGEVVFRQSPMTSRSDVRTNHLQPNRNLERDFCLLSSKQVCYNFVNARCFVFAVQSVSRQWT